MSALRLHKLYSYKGKIYVPLLAQCRPLVGDIVLNRHNLLDMVITCEADIIDKGVLALIDVYGGTLAREHVVTRLDNTVSVDNQLLGQVIGALEGEGIWADLILQLRVAQEASA